MPPTDALTARPASDDDWKPLYRIAAVCAALVLVLVPIQIYVFLRWPPPVSVADWFALFGYSRVIGLIDMDALLIIDQVLIAVVCLALYIALRRARPALMAIALLFAVVALATYISSNPAFQMMHLSDRYAAATTELEHLQALGAGEAMVATWLGSAFDVSYVLGAFAFLIIANVMRRSTVFSRTTATVGIVAGVVSLVPASAGTPGHVLSLLALLPLWLWLALIARRFVQLAH